MQQENQLATFYLATSTPGTPRAELQHLLQQAGFEEVDYHLPHGYLKPAAQGLKSKAPSPALTWLKSKDTKDLSQWLNDFPDTHIFLLYTRPEVYLQEAIAKDQLPEQALDTWQKAAKQLLTLYRSNRARCTLLMAEPCLANPKASMQQLSNKLGWQLPEKAWQSEALKLEENQELLLASQLVMQHSELRELLNELEASSTNSARLQGPLKFDCDFFISQAKKMWQEAQEKYQQATEDGEMLIEQLHQVQEQLEGELNKTKKNQQLIEQLKNTQKDLEGELAQSKQKQAKLEKEHQESQEENDLLIEQLHFTQEELEQQLIEHQKLLDRKNELQREVNKRKKEKQQAEKDADKKQSRINQLQKEKQNLDKELSNVKSAKTRLLKKYLAIFDSTSWKVTKPLRALGRLLKGKPMRAKAGQRGSN